MAAKIIPAILAKNRKEFEEKVKVVSALGLRQIQIDIMDGRFVKDKTFVDLSIIKPSLKIEAHLMIKNPDKEVEKWARGKAVFRVILHFEAVRKEKIKLLFNKIKAYNKEAGIAINPETPVSKIKPFLNSLDYVLVLAVTPGKSGQKFQKIALKKIRQLKSLKPNLKVGVDGGIGPENVGEIIRAGADVLNVASAIFGVKDYKKAYKDMGKLIY